LLMNLR